MHLRFNGDMIFLFEKTHIDFLTRLNISQPQFLISSLKFVTAIGDGYQILFFANPFEPLLALNNLTIFRPGTNIKTHDVNNHYIVFSNIFNLVKYPSLSDDIIP